MSPKSADDLARFLIRIQLLTPQQVEESLAEFGMRHADADEFLQVLERRGALTSYQAAQIRKGSTDLLVLDGYRLLYRNASGSFARVFRAESIADGRTVGLKLLRQRWAKDPHIVDQFRREALLCKRFRHKNVVPIFDVGQDNGHHFFTMEFVEGGNLRDFIKIRGHLSPEEATRCVLDMARGLEYALRLGVTHRDLKLTNVLMSAEGVAKLVDFGLAGHDGVPGLENDEATQRALEYAALENGTGAPENDPRSDLFFLGAIYYELLTGTPPYRRTRSREERKRLSRYRDVRPLSSVDPTIPSSVADVVGRLMEVNAAERYQNPTELIADLKAVLRELAPDRAPSTDEEADRDTGTPPVVLCIENRVKQQDILRKYLTRHGFRVLLLGDLQRALNRLQNDPPDCVILMGQPLGKGAVAAYRELVQATKNSPVAGVMVLSREQSHFQKDCPRTAFTRVLVQPVTMRDVRKEVQQLLRSRRQDLDSLIDLSDGSEDSAVARI